MAEDVLVASAEAVSRAADLPTPEFLSVLLQSAIFLPREKAENDRRYRQIIPYVVLRYGDDLFSYVRISGSEARLEGKVSVGIGGHVSRADLGAT